MRPLLLILLALFSIAFAKDYCGPGPLTMPASKEINECCKQHDADYDTLSWWERFIPWKKAPFEIKFCKCLQKVNSAHAWLKCAVLIALIPIG